jgi:monofunctional biosynthetic peptidoglycan transglycosylase
MRSLALVTCLTLIAGAGAMAEERKLYDFTDPEAAAGWVAVHDVVMGGLSSGGLEATEAGSMLFEGVVSLENNGGFASIRSKPGSHDLSAYDGIVIRFRGDGKRYKLNLKSDSSFDGVMYRVPFETVDGEWQELRFPFAEFRATFRGRFVPDAPPLDPARITTFGLLISDKQEGPFRMEISGIGAYAKSDQQER